MPKLQPALRQVYRIAALGVAMGMQEEQAAAQANISVDTLARYRRDERFQEMVEEFNHQIEQKAIERVQRRRMRVIAKAQMLGDEAIEHAVEIMRSSPQDSVRWQVIKGILRQLGVDMDSLAHSDDDIDVDAIVEKQDPKFHQRAEEARKELAAWNKS